MFMSFLCVVFRRRLLTRRRAIVTKKTALDKQNAVLLLPIRA
ncbi:hypothetical protein [Neisseria sicca]|nr:hypothetical protein [Neisseria sicca]